MLWAIFSIFSAFFDGIKNLYMKKLTKHFDEYLLAFSTSIIISLFLLPIILIKGIPTLESGFGFSLLITGIINTITLVLILKALKLTDISLVAPIFSLSPALLLITSPIIIGEFPSLSGLLGVCCILIGTYILNFKGKISFAPISAIIKNQGQRLIVIVAMLWAISSNFYKIGMQTSSPVFFIFSLNVLISTIIFPSILKNGRLKIIKNNYKKLIPLGVLSGMTSLFQWVAVSMTLIIYALSIKRLSIIISVIGGSLIFKEKRSKQRILATAVMLLGIYLITMFK